MSDPTQSQAEAAFQPRIVAFLCNWCSYTASDLAGTARIKYSPCARIIRVMCSGRVDPSFVLKAFALGADGVMIAGCHPGDCHYIEQNYKTIRRQPCSATSSSRWGSSRTGCGWSGPRPPKASTWPSRSTASWQMCGSWVRWTGRPTGRTISGRHATGRYLQNKPRAGGAGMSGESKGKLALYWAASCGGCEIAVLAINEKILDVAAACRHRLLARGGRCQGPRRREDGGRHQSTSACSTAASAPASRSTWPVCCVRSRRCWWPSGPAPARVAFPGWPTCNNRREIFDTVYHDTPSTENPSQVRAAAGDRSAGRHAAPAGVLRHACGRLDQTVPVDYYLPGCPPEAERIWDAITAIVDNQLPPPGSVIGAETTVCQECPRVRTRRRSRSSTAPGRSSPTRRRACWSKGCCAAGSPPAPAAEPAARQVNSPCIGCYGPNEGVDDFGAADDGGPGLDHRLGRSGGDRPHHPRRDSRSGGQLLSLQPGGQPAPAEPVVARRKRQVTGDATGIDCHARLTPTGDAPCQFSRAAIRRLYDDYCDQRAHLDRPHHAPGRSRQDRHLPGRARGSGQRLPADPRVARLRAVLRGPRRPKTCRT